MEKKELTISEPMLKTYQYSAYLEIIGSNDQRTNNWIMNNYIEWNCISDCINPNLCIIDANPWETVPFILKNTIELKLLVSDIQNYIHKMLDNDYYVMLTGIDEFFLESSRFFLTKHYLHDILIYGYDKSNYSVAGYTQNRKFEFYHFPKTDIKLAIESELAQRNYYSAISALKLKSTKEFPYNIDLNTILNQINNYLYSICRANSPSNLIYGVDVYDFIIDKACNNNSLDLKIFRLIKEHKYIMLNRLKLINQKFKSFPYILIDEYEIVLKKAELVFMLAIKFNMTQKKQLIVSIRENLTNIKKLEIKILQKLLTI